MVANSSWDLYLLSVCGWYSWYVCESLLTIHLFFSFIRARMWKLDKRIEVHDCRYKFLSISARNWEMVTKRILFYWKCARDVSYSYGKCFVNIDFRLLFFSVTIKELKSFLGRVNCKMSTAKLLEHFNEIDVRKRGELRFDDFSHLFQKLLVTQNVMTTDFAWNLQLLTFFCSFVDHSRVLQLLWWLPIQQRQWDCTTTKLSVVFDQRSRRSIGKRWSCCINIFTWLRPRSIAWRSGAISYNSWGISNKKCFSVFFFKFQFIVNSSSTTSFRNKIVFGTLVMTKCTWIWRSHCRTTGFHLRITHTWLVTNFLVNPLQKLMFEHYEWVVVASN